MRQYFLDHETGKVSLSDTGPPPGDLVVEIDGATFYRLLREDLEQPLNDSTAHRPEAL